MRSLELPISSDNESFRKDLIEEDGFGFWGETRVFSYQDQQLSVSPKSGDSEPEYFDVQPLDINLASLSDDLPNPRLRKEEFRQELVNRRSRAKEYGRQFAKQRIKISELVNSIYQIISTDVEFKGDDLYEMIVEQAAECYLTPVQIEDAFLVVEKMVKRRNQINKFLEDNNCSRNNANPDKLFHALTGIDPVGKVEVELTPITIHVRCFSKDDYETLYKNSDGVSSGGVALNYIAGLQNIVTAENASINVKHEPIDMHETMSETHWQCQLGDIAGIVINSEKLRWQIRIHKNDDGSYDLYYTEGTISNGSVQNKPERHYRFNASTNKWIGEGVKGSSKLRLPASTLNIFVNGADTLDILRPTDVEVTLFPKYKKPAYNQVVANKDFSQAIIVHELQHQVNSLLDMALTNDNKGRAFDQSREDEEGYADGMQYNEVIRTLHLFSQARNEIIAYYRGGRSLEDIPDTLTEDKLYLPHYLSDENLQVALKNLPQINVPASDPKLKVYIEEKFKRFVELCITAIAEFEQLGLNRDDIIAILVSLPATSWPATARRMRNYLSN